MKHISSNFKQGIKIGMLVALTISMAMTTGCEMPNGGTTGGNENPGNGGNSGNNNGSTDNEQTGNQYGEPSSRTIGNGNYTLHNFVGDNYYASAKTIVEDVNYYLGKGETYVKGLADQFNTSVNGRTNYFNELIAAIKNDNYFYIDPNDTGSRNLDNAANTISYACEPICAEIIKNLKDEDEQYALYYSYRILANEAYKEGLGSYRQYSSALMNEYEDEKANIEREAIYVPALQKIGLQAGQAYDDNFFNELTSLTDELLEIAVSNMGQSIKLEDLQQVINLSLIPQSLRGMHGLTKNNLGHNYGCSLDLNVAYEMDHAIGSFKTVNQEQGLSL